MVYMMQGFESLYVYTNVVESCFFGDSLVLLLRIVPIHGGHGRTVPQHLDHVQYLLLLCKGFGTIEIDIRDDTGRPVPFERGKVTVTLHVRRRKTSLFRRMNYNDYYARQAGDTLPFFVGARVQWGHGWYSQLGSLLRSCSSSEEPWLSGSGH